MLLHRGAYLRDAWCQLDFIVVSLAWLPIIFPSMGNTSSLRAVRALRPLRALKRVPGMPLLVQWILEVLPKLGTVMLLCSFIFLVFGIVGMELFKGTTHYRCALPGFVPTAGHPSLEAEVKAAAAVTAAAGVAAEMSPKVIGDDMPQRLASRLLRPLVPDSLGSQHPYDTGVVCSPTNPVRCKIGGGETCAYFDHGSPHGGAIESFDSILHTFVMLMEAITFDGWAEPMYDVMGYFDSPWVSLYFVLIVVLGGFFVVNLFLAVVFLEFARAREVMANESRTARSAQSARSSRSEEGEAATHPLLPAQSPRSDALERMHGGSLAASMNPRTHGCCDCRAREGSWREPLTRFVTSEALNHASTALVIVNMVFMCMPYYGMSDGYAAHLEQATSAITWAFIVEMLLKLVGLGCWAYWSDKWNALDGTIVLLSIFELVLTALSQGTGVKLSFLRMLRMLRILRLLKLMRSWRGLYKIVTTFVAAIPQMGNIGLLLFLTAFMFALLGMQLFGGIFTEANGYRPLDGGTTPDGQIACAGGVCADGMRDQPRSHFDYCGPAMLSVFVVLTGEWVDVMEPVTDIVGPFAALFFITLTVIGKYILVNLLIAVILKNFEESGGVDDKVPARSRRTSHEGDDADGEVPTWSVDQAIVEQAIQQQQQQQLYADWAYDGGDGEGMSVPTVHTLVCMVNLEGHDVHSGTIAAFQDGRVRGVATPSPRYGPYTGSCVWSLTVYAPVAQRVGLAYAPLPLTTFRFWNGTEVVQLDQSIYLDGTQPESSFERPAIFTGRVDVPAWPIDYSLFCCSKVNPLRRVCAWLVRRPLFDYFILLTILASSVCLALDTPRLNPASDLAHTIRKLDFVFTAVFFVEMALKIVAHGFFFAKRAYLTDPWNRLDFVIVTASLLALLAQAVPEVAAVVPSQGLRAARLLRVLRPLRLISRHEGMKVIITSLFHTLPAVSEVFGVVLVLQLVFAILGMQLFAGSMAMCSDPTIKTHDACVAEATRSGRALTWANPDAGSFDSFWEAMRLLYIMSSADEWPAKMYGMMDATGPGLAPIRNDFSWASLFSLCWMMIGFIFAMNLVVGVVVDDFSTRHKEEAGAAIMTNAQTQWVGTMKALMSYQLKPVVRPPKGSVVRDRVHSIVTSTLFDATITLVIVVNIVLMAANSWGFERSGRIYNVYETTMFGITCVYYVECALKIVGLGFSGYFADSWCCFDFFLVCTSLVELLAEDFLTQLLPLPPMLLRVLRIFRILRIIRLLKKSKGLRDLIVTVVLSLPALFNVGSLLAIVIFIYSILGVQLFTFVADGRSLDDERNFHSIGEAALLLFQCLTGDGWARIMEDASVSEASGGCSEDAGDCGSLAAAIPYFISFQLIGSFIFLNLVVAVVLENFSMLHNTDPTLASHFDLAGFAEAWAVLDPDATQFIPSSQLVPLLLSVPRPLGLRGRTEHEATRLCMRLALPQHRGLVAYSEVLHELVTHSYFYSSTDDDHSRIGGDEDAFRHDIITKGALPNDFALPPLPNTPRAHEAMRIVRKQPNFDQNAPTVAHVYAMQQIRRYLDRHVIDTWRIEHLKRARGEERAKGIFDVHQSFHHNAAVGPYLSTVTRPARAAPTPPSLSVATPPAKSPGMAKRLTLNFSRAKRGK